MKPTSTDPFGQRLGESLAALDGGGASPGFTDRVLEELMVRQARKRRRRHRALGAAGVVLVATIAAFISLDARREPTVDVASEAEQLRQEYARLQNDLEALRKSARETAPVIYLGGDDEMDLVLDLAPMVTQSAASAVRIDPYEL